MKVFIAGVDGYIGWALANHLVGLGHEVSGIDNLTRRKQVAEMGSISAMPIAEFRSRQKLLKQADIVEGDLTDYELVSELLQKHKPDAIVHLGECPSAPYSMMSADKAAWVQQNNVVGTLNILFAMRDIVPNCHLVKLGTMGEYGTPNVDIPEGFFEFEYNGRKDTLQFPRQPGSFYHLSKVHDTHNVSFACKMWGLRSTDIMQGVVYGTRWTDQPIKPGFGTRLDFDEAFGTAINRFCCQAVIGHPLTLYGSGHQKRGFLSLRDSIQCLTLIIQNPPKEGEYRVANQIDEVYDLTELADCVKEEAAKLGINATIENLTNPRIELEEHRYVVERKVLPDLGYEPSKTLAEGVSEMLSDLNGRKGEIEKHRKAVVPQITWNPAEPLDMSEEPIGDPHPCDVVSQEGPQGVQGAQGVQGTQGA